MKKNLIEMTAQELREEIGRLTTTLEKVHTKNRQRKRALKDINRSVLIKNALISDTFSVKRMMAARIDTLTVKIKFLEDELERQRRFREEQTPFGKKVTFVGEEHGPKVEARETRRWFHFGRAKA